MEFFLRDYGRLMDGVFKGVILKYGNKRNDVAYLN